MENLRYEVDVSKWRLIATGHLSMLLPQAAVLKFLKFCNVVESTNEM